MRFLCACIAAPLNCVRLLHKNRELCRLMVLRTLHSRFRGSWLGILWLVLMPLFLLAVYTFVFGTIFKGHFGVVRNETPIDYALGIFVGLNFLNFFNDCLAGAPGVIVGNANLVKKVVFPLEILPLSWAVSSLCSLLAGSVLALLGVVVLGSGLSASVLWLPVIIAPICLYCIGITWIFSALGVFFRDLSQFLQIVALCMLWVSGVFYSPEKLPRVSWLILRFNPILQANELARNTVLWHQGVHAGWLGYLFLSGGVTFSVGFALFQRLKPAFADVL